MTRVLLLPRLNELGVMRIIDDVGSEVPTVKEVLDILDEHSSFLWFAPSGGSVSAESAVDIAREIRQIAERHGFPESSDQKSRSAFDAEVTTWLGDQDILSTGEALRDDVWAFLSSALLADVVSWRFPDRNLERFRGGVRNAFQRLWIRGVTLDLGPGSVDRWQLVHALSEDAMVQIFERASLAGDRKLARAIASAWMVTSGRIGRGRMEEVMRAATKMVRLRNEIIDLGELEQSVLTREIEKIFFRVAGVTDDLTASRPFATAES